MKVSVFIPCYINQFRPSLGIAMIDILERLGCEVTLETEAFCCGQPAYNAGFSQEAIKVSQLFFDTYKVADHIVIPSASCAGFLKNYATQLIKEKEKDIYYLAKYQVKKISEFADFLYHHFDMSQLGLSFPHKVAYHTSCASLREYPCVDVTKALLGQVKDLELISFEYSETCCGFGGTFSHTFSDLSVSMAQHKLTQLEKAGVEYVLSNDFSCLMHLESVAKKHRMKMIFQHISECFL